MSAVHKQRPSRPPLSAFLLLGAALAAPVCAEQSETWQKDPLLSALSAEFALQAGNPAQAAADYERAVEEVTDPAWLERATMISLHANDLPRAGRVAERWLVLKPKDTRALQAVAWVSIAQGAVESATLRLAQLIAADGLDGARLAVQVLLTGVAKPHAQAVLDGLEAQGSLLSADPAEFSFVPAALALGHVVSGLSIAQADLDAHPQSGAAFRWRAQAHYAAGALGLAEADLAEAVGREPDNRDWRMAWAALLSEQDDAAKTLSVLADAPEQDAEKYATRISYAAEAEDDKALKRLARELGKRTDEELPERVLFLGQVAELRERWEEALKWYAQVPPGPGFVDSRMRMAVVYSNDEPDLRRAREQLAELRVPSVDPNRQIDSWLLETELLNNADRRDEAEPVFQAALDEYPNSERLLYSRAINRVSGDDLAGAEADLLRILSFDPNNSQALNALGYTLADRTDRHSEALAYIQRALDIAPDEGAILDSMGWVQYRLGHPEKAVEYLKRAHEVANDAEIAAHYGEVLHVIGEVEKAVEVWKKALESSPEDAVLIETVNRLAPELR